VSDKDSKDKDKAKRLKRKAEKDKKVIFRSVSTGDFKKKFPLTVFTTEVPPPPRCQSENDLKGMDKTQPLPTGWEQGLTAEGLAYYIK